MLNYLWWKNYLGIAMNPQTITWAKPIKRHLWFRLIFICTVVLYGFASQKHNNKKLILGKWEGKADKVSAVIIFDTEQNGSLKYSNAAIAFKFKYKFKSDTVIMFISKHSKATYRITLAPNKVRFLPYPKGTHETIELFNEMDFHRIK
ncbi:MAG: hypothetical protein EOO43_26395 [Flavobacterium sp.]|nr:MAG: hypothetical protein EOO43_26395 [Flavobacterium sp.]